MGSMQVEVLGEKRYTFVCVNDISWYTWLKFIPEKSDTSKVFRSFCLHIQKEQDRVIMHIGSDHEKEFENSAIDKVLLEWRNL